MAVVQLLLGQGQLRDHWFPVLCQYRSHHTRHTDRCSLFGGRLLQWIDEEAALYAIVQLETPRCVTKYISEINFISSAKQGDIIEVTIEADDTEIPVSEELLICLEDEPTAKKMLAMVTEEVTAQMEQEQEFAENSEIPQEE